MLFTRTYRYKSSRSMEEIKNRLLGKHMIVHNMDFEVSGNESMLRIIPHAEEVQALKTLPITHVEMQGKGNQTQVTISSKMRKIDSGGPMLIVIFCMFMLIAALMFFAYGGPQYAQVSYILGGISVAIFIIFWIKMESGYFDYIRKIRDYVKKEGVA